MSDEKITLNDLKGENTVTDLGSLTQVDPSIISKSLNVEEKSRPENPVLAEINKSLSNVVEDTKKEAIEFLKAKQEEDVNNEIESLMTSDTPKESTTSIKVSENPETKLVIEDGKNEVETDIENDNVSSVGLDDEELKALEAEIEGTTDEELEIRDEMAEIKKVIKETIKPTANVIDLSSFKISKNPISISNALSILNNSSTEQVVDWVLYSAKKPFSIKEFKGSEIEALNPKSGGRNRLNVYTSIYKLIYDHIVDANKPATMEAWIKTIKFKDLNHLYFGIYKASFLNANTIPFNCTDKDCKEIFMKNINIDDMVKYKDSAIKAEVEKILVKDTNSTNESNKINTYPYQISDDYVFAIKDPSVYNVIFENAVLDEQFTAKYKDTLALITYIDTIYYINRSTNELQPLQVKEYADNLLKTVKAKIITFTKIINNLTPDQFSYLNGIINSLNNDDNQIQYILPEVTCPKCGKAVPEIIQSAEQLLFTRHQLVSIANTLNE